MMKRILCFGDSNTYGYIPGGYGRYDRRTRWPGVLQNLLGDQYRVFEDGVNGRTTIFAEEPYTDRCGLDAIGASAELYGPLDLLIIMLGSNDCKTFFGASARTIAGGMACLVKAARESGGDSLRILILSPIRLDSLVKRTFFGSFDDESLEKAKGLAAEYRKVAEEYGCDFLDASKAAEPSAVDGLHLDKDGHRAIAVMTAEYIRRRL